MKYNSKYKSIVLKSLKSASSTLSALKGASISIPPDFEGAGAVRSALSTLKGVNVSGLISKVSSSADKFEAAENAVAGLSSDFLGLFGDIFLNGSSDTKKKAAKTSKSNRSSQIESELNKTSKKKDNHDVYHALEKEKNKKTSSMKKDSKDILQTILSWTTVGDPQNAPTLEETWKLVNESMRKYNESKQKNGVKSTASSKTNKSIDKNSLEYTMMLTNEAMREYNANLGKKKVKSKTKTNRANIPSSDTINKLVKESMDKYNKEREKANQNSKVTKFVDNLLSQNDIWNTDRYKEASEAYNKAMKQYVKKPTTSNSSTTVKKGSWQESKILADEALREYYASKEEFKPVYDSLGDMLSMGPVELVYLTGRFGIGATRPIDQSWDFINNEIVLLDNKIAIADGRLDESMLLSAANTSGCKWADATTVQMNDMMSDFINDYNQIFGTSHKMENLDKVGKHSDAIGGLTTKAVIKKVVPGGAIISTGISIASAGSKATEKYLNREGIDRNNPEDIYRALKAGEGAAMIKATTTAVTLTGDSAMEAFEADEIERYILNYTIEFANNMITQTGGFIVQEKVDGKDYNLVEYLPGIITSSAGNAARTVVIDATVDSVKPSIDSAVNTVIPIKDKSTSDKDKSTSDYSNSNSDFIKPKEVGEFNEIKKPTIILNEATKILGKETVKNTADEVLPEVESVKASDLKYEK